MSGRLLLVAGLVVILTLSIDVLVRIVCALLWCLLLQAELRRIERSHLFCSEIRLHFDGRVEVRSSVGEWHIATLQSGSIVLDRMAWIHLRVAGGPNVLEAYRGDARESQDWRRLQVLWRHVGAWL